MMVKKHKKDTERGRHLRLQHKKNQIVKIKAKSPEAHFKEKLCTFAIS